MADEAKKHQVKNVTAGPRGLHGRDGFVQLEKGESAVVHLTDAELKSAKAAGHFEFDSAADTPKPLAKMKEAELRALAEAEGVVIPEGAKVADIAGAIEADRKAKADAASGT